MSRAGADRAGARQLPGLGGRRLCRASRSSSPAVAAARLASSTARSTAARLTATCRGASIPSRTLSLRTSTTVRTMSSPMTICSPTRRLSTSTEPTLPPVRPLGCPSYVRRRRLGPFGRVGGGVQVTDPGGPTGTDGGRAAVSSPPRAGGVGHVDGDLEPAAPEDPAPVATGPHDPPADLLG